MANTMPPEIIYKAVEIVALGAVFVGVTKWRLSALETSVKNMASSVQAMALAQAGQVEINSSRDNQLEKIYDRLDGHDEALGELEVDVAVIKKVISLEEKKA